MKLDIRQYRVLASILRDKFYYDHFKIYDLENLEGLMKMTDNQYRYFLALFGKRKWFDIKKLLDNFLTHK